VKSESTKTTENHDGDLKSRLENSKNSENIINSENIKNSEDVKDSENTKNSDPTVDPAVADSTLQIRFPDGSVMKSGFKETTTLNIVFKYVISRMRVLGTGQSMAGKSYSLVTSYPRKKFNEQEMNTLTLKEANLVPRAVLIIEENK